MEYNFVLVIQVKQCEEWKIFGGIKVSDPYLLTDRKHSSVEATLSLWGLGDQVRGWIWPAAQCSLRPLLLWSRPALGNDALEELRADRQR